jgi:hypothetical protein
MPHTYTLETRWRGFFRSKVRPLLITYTLETRWRGFFRSKVRPLLIKVRPLLIATSDLSRLDYPKIRS